jgi:hypothetical protein
LLHYILEMAGLELERHHQVISCPGALKTDIVIFFFHDITIVVDLLLEGKVSDPEGNIAPPAPATITRGKVPLLCKVICAEDSAVGRNKAPALAVQAESAEAGPAGLSALFTWDPRCGKANRKR